MFVKLTPVVNFTNQLLCQNLQTQVVSAEKLGKTVLYKNKFCLKIKSQTVGAEIFCKTVNYKKCSKIFG